jgi:hypothetical protein
VIHQRVTDRQPRLGIDIGRVIIDGPADSHEDTGFFTGDDAAMLATPEVPGAVDAIARLAHRFEGRVWLVSKCGPWVQARTGRWLVGHDFFGRTGVPAEHVRFCRRRAEKRAHCVALGLTHFVDDRPEVHEAIRDVVEHQYFFGPQSEPVPDYGLATPTWSDVERLIDRSLTAPAGP